MAKLTDFQRAKARATALGYPDVTTAIATRLGVPNSDPQVRKLCTNLSRGLGSRRTMVSMAEILGVPDSFWLETNEKRLWDMIQEQEAPK